MVAMTSRYARMTGPPLATALNMPAGTYRRCVLHHSPKLIFWRGGSWEALGYLCGKDTPKEARIVEQGTERGRKTGARMGTIFASRPRPALAHTLRATGHGHARDTLR